MAERDSMQALDYEIAREKAGALRRVAGVLEQHLTDLRSVQATLEGASDADRPRIEKRTSELWRESERTLWYLIVQREAMGLSHHDDVYISYRIPKGMVPRL